MEDSTPQRAFRPTSFENNKLIHRITPWSFARLLEVEARWLLRKVFPVWAESGDPLTRMIWTRMCHELLVGTGEAIEDIWRTRYPDGELDTYCWYSPDGLHSLVGLKRTEDGRQIQVHLAELVYFELKKERSKTAEGDGVLTFMDVIREEYQQVPDLERQGTTAGEIAEAAMTIAASWKPFLREMLQDETTWRMPMPPARKPTTS